MKSCCKNPDNWQHDGSRNKKVVDRGNLVQITSENYLTCNVCGGKMSMFVDKSVVDAHRKERVTSERP